MNKRRRSKDASEQPNPTFRDSRFMLDPERKDAIREIARLWREVIDDINRSIGHMPSSIPRERRLQTAIAESNREKSAKSVALLKDLGALSDAEMAYLDAIQEPIDLTSTQAELTATIREALGNELGPVRSMIRSLIGQVDPGCRKGPRESLMRAFMNLSAEMPDSSKINVFRKLAELELRTAKTTPDECTWLNRADRQRVHKNAVSGRPAFCKKDVETFAGTLQRRYNRYTEKLRGSAHARMNMHE